VVSQCSLHAWLKELAGGDQRRLTGSGSALEVCYMLMRNTNPRFLYFILLYYYRGYLHVLKYLLLLYKKRKKSDADSRRVDLRTSVRDSFAKVSRSDVCKPIGLHYSFLLKYNYK